MLVILGVLFDGAVQDFRCQVVNRAKPVYNNGTPGHDPRMGKMVHGLVNAWFTPDHRMDMITAWT